MRHQYLADVEERLRHSVGTSEKKLGRATCLRRDPLARLDLASLRIVAWGLIALVEVIRRHSRISVREIEAIAQQRVLSPELRTSRTRPQRAPPPIGLLMLAPPLRATPAVARVRALPLISG